MSDRAIAAAGFIGAGLLDALAAREDSDRVLAVEESMQRKVP